MNKKIDEFKNIVIYWLNKFSYILILFTLMFPLLYLVKYHLIKDVDLLSWIQLHDVIMFLLPMFMFIYLVRLIIKKFRIDIYDILLYGLIITAILSTIFSVNQFVSVYGTYLRNDGLLVMLFYYFIFLEAKEVMNKDKIYKCINIILIMALAQFIYSILQVFLRTGIYGFVMKDIYYMASGFTGNPNFLGSYVVMSLSLSTAMFLFSKEHNKLYFFVSILLFINLILAQSTGPFLSYIAILVFLLIILLIKKKDSLKKYLIIFLTELVLFIPVSCFIESYCVDVFDDKIVSYYTIKGDFQNLFIHNGGKDKEEENSTFTGSGRVHIWRKTLSIAPKYLITGSGIDTFAFVYPQNIQSGIIYDKAHNEYLQILITEGILSLIIYLVLVFTLFVKSIKRKDTIIIVLMVSMCGYLVQAFLNIQTYSVAPAFFIIMGLLAGLLKDKGMNTNEVYSGK